MKNIKKVLALALVVVSVFAMALPALASTYNYEDYFSGNTLKRGNTSTAVMNLQMALDHLGYNVGPIDGIFGSLTERAVKYFQEDTLGLAIDGQAGKYTKTAIWKLLTNQFVDDELFNISI